MQQTYSTNRVIENVMVAEGIYRLTAVGEFNVKPGQFFLLRSWEEEPFLSRPVSIHDCEEGKISFLYEVRGEGTKLLSKLQENDEIQLLGPLGNGFNVENIGGKVAVIAGGIGIAPMKYLVRELKNRGCEVDLYAGFRSASHSLEELKEYTNEIFVTTEDGSEGHKGYVTEVFSPVEYNAVLCCGPEVMMKRVVEVCGSCCTPVYVSMESHMACGLGACLVCACKTNSGNKRVCKDGPVFSGRDVMFSA